MKHLLDVNVLLAMYYVPHVHHKRVDHWLRQCRIIYGAALTLATSPITELGFVRIASGSTGFAPSVAAAQRDLERLITQNGILFVGDRLPARRLPRWVSRSAQTTDGHLVELATSHGMILATLDRGVPGAELIPDLPEHPFEVRESEVLADEGFRLPAAEYPAPTRSVGLWLR